MRPYLIIVAFILFAACVFFRQNLEMDPVTHVLFLLPILAFAGALIAVGMNLRGLQVGEPNANALTLIAVFAILFWMLPRYIDASLESPAIELAKFISIPILVGGLLAVVWQQTHPFLRGFLKANALSMLGVLAFLYTHAPIRICNSYLVIDQQRLGYGFLFLAAALAVAWTIPLFLPPHETGQTSQPGIEKEMT